MPSLEYLRKQKCMLEHLIVKQERILEQCSNEDAQEQTYTFIEKTRQGSTVGFKNTRQQYGKHGNI